MRIGVAILLLYDWLQRLANFELLYTEKGIFSNGFLQHSGYLGSGDWSLFFLSGSEKFTLTLFAIGILFSVAMLVGVFTSFSIVISWVLQVSIQNKNPFVLHSGDSLLLLVLILFFFLNLSKDISSQEKRRKELEFLGLNFFIFFLAILGFIFITTSLHFISALNKFSKEWLSDFNAVYYVFSNKDYSRNFTSVFLNYPLILKFFCISTVAIEFIAPLLILAGFRCKKFKNIGLLLLLILQAGMLFFLTISWFNFLVIILLLFVWLIPFEFIVENIKIFFSKGAINSIFKLKAFSAYLIFILICCSTLLNIRQFPYQASKSLSFTLRLLKINADWAMFSPSVRKDQVLIQIKNGKSSNLQAKKLGFINGKEHRLVKLRENIHLLNDHNLNMQVKKYLINPRNDSIDLTLEIRRPKSAFSTAYLRNSQLLR